MKTIDRRDFLKIAGAGTAVVVAGVAMPVAGFFTWSKKDVLRFRAVAGMPKAPLPTYATYVVAGEVNLTSGSGGVGNACHCGAPDSVSGMGSPGTASAI